VLVDGSILARASSATGFAAIALGVVGLLLLFRRAEAKGFHLRGTCANRAAAGGASGAFVRPFPLCAYRGASLAVMNEQPVLRGGGDPCGGGL